jgi:hypothetical protein
MRPDVSVCDGAIARWVWGEAGSELAAPSMMTAPHRDEWAAIDAGLAWMRRASGAE